MIPGALETRKENTKNWKQLAMFVEMIPLQDLLKGNVADPWGKKSASEELEWLALLDWVRNLASLKALEVENSSHPEIRWHFSNPLSLPFASNTNSSTSPPIQIEPNQ